MTLRFGLIGLGMMGRHHARVAREVEGVELVAVADAMGDPHGVAGNVPLYDSVEKLIEHGVDAVVVAVRTQFHQDVGLKTSQQQAYTRSSRNRLRTRSRRASSWLMLSKRTNSSVQSDT